MHESVACWRGIVLTGPTASGKSRLALALAQRLPAVIINADSMQCYHELRILTARPSEADEKQVPHEGYGMCSARDPLSAVSWARMARVSIDRARDQGRLPILVGGSGLYLRALLRGLSTIAPVAPAVREEALALEARLGIPALHGWLAERDPETGGRLRRNDRQRILRAVEVWLATGQGLAAWHRSAPVMAPVTGSWGCIALMPDRDLLRRRARQRIETMIGEGVLDEIADLLDRKLEPQLPLMKAVGLRELARLVRGETGPDEALDRALVSTMRYAKQQMTWLRTQTKLDLPISVTISDFAPGPFTPEIERICATLAAHID